MTIDKLTFIIPLIFTFLLLNNIQSPHYSKAKKRSAYSQNYCSLNRENKRFFHKKVKRTIQVKSSFVKKSHSYKLLRFVTNNQSDKIALSDSMLKVTSLTQLNAYLDSLRSY